MANAGHRLGEVDTSHKENTIARMKANVKFQQMKSFKYWEFDVNETADGYLVVYHDRDFKKYGNKQKLRDMGLKEIRQCYPFVPTLVELKDAMAKQDIIKPIRIEIKRLVSDQGRERALLHALWFKRDVFPDVDFIAFKSHFKKSFPKKTRDDWGDKFEAEKFAILNVKDHDENLFDSIGWFDWWWF